MRSFASSIQRVRDFRSNNDGVAAIEFALIAPILMIFLFGVFELGRAYSAHRRFMSATYMIGDLVTREKEVSAATNCMTSPPASGECLRGIYKLVKPALGSFASDTSTMSVSVIPLYQDPTSKEVLVYASPEGYNPSSPKPACGAPTVTVDADTKAILQNNPVIIVTSTYKFKPIFSYPLVGSMTWSYQTTVSPRQGCVTFTSATCTKAPAAC